MNQATQPSEEARTGSTRGVQSVEIGGRVLMAIAAANGPSKLRDIAGAAMLPAAQAHAYLVSLRNVGIVEQTPAGLYELGPFALEIGLIRLRASDPYEQIWEALPAWSEKLNLAMTMSVWGTYGPTVIRVFDTPYQIYTRLRPGAHFQLLNTATGRLFAAFMQPTLVEPVLTAEFKEASKNNGHPGGLKAYRAALAQVRAEGCATTIGNPIPGIGAISVPIFDLNDRMIAAVTAIGPEELIDDKIGSSQREALLALGRGMSVQLGAGSHPVMVFEEP